MASAGVSTVPPCGGLFLFRKNGKCSKGMGQAGISFAHRGSSGASPAAELPLWSKLRKFLPSVDTERRNGYNTYRVRPKRSAIYEQVFSPIRGITALRTAGRLFLSDSDSYGLNVALKRSKQHHNQFYHTSHLLSDGVLTADCPWYYTCKYYNAYVEICLY